MILVDVVIPELDAVVDVQLDETLPIDRIISELSGLIAAKVQNGGDPDVSNRLLCSMDQQLIFQKNVSLRSYGVKNGSRLMLV